MKITQSWKRNTPTTDGYSLTVTYVYSSKWLHEIDEIETKLPKGIIIMDTPITGSFLTNEQAEQFKNAFNDFVQVIRCKDCVECYFASNRIQSEQTFACGKHGIDVTPDWYCADGERKPE